MALQNIELINDVLLLSGERPVVSLVTPVGRKGALSVRAAVEDIVLANAHWPFLKVVDPPISYVDGILSTVKLREINSVSFKGHELTPRQLADLEANPYSYAIIDEETIEVNTKGAASDYVVAGVKDATYDYGDPTANIPLPDRFRSILLTQGVYRMAVDHLGDYEQAQAKANEFAAAIRRMIAREDGLGSRNRNMYRRRR